MGEWRRGDKREVEEGGEVRKAAYSPCSLYEYKARTDSEDFAASSP